MTSDDCEMWKAHKKASQDKRVTDNWVHVPDEDKEIEVPE